VTFEFTEAMGNDYISIAYLLTFLMQLHKHTELSENLMLLVSLWDEGEGSPWQPFYRRAKKWLGSHSMWPLPLHFVPKVWWLS
jgi:hypothetical protein